MPRFGNDHNQIMNELERHSSLLGEIRNLLRAMATTPTLSERVAAELSAEWVNPTDEYGRPKNLQKPESQ